MWAANDKRLFDIFEGREEIRDLEAYACEVGQEPLNAGIRLETLESVVEEDARFEIMPNITE